MHPIALTIAALICYAGSLTGGQSVASARHTFVEEPESPSMAIALKEQGRSRVALVVRDRAIRL